MNIEKIDYTVKYNSLSKSIRILINSKGKVIVTAPRWVSLKVIDKFVNSKIVWIKDNLKKVKNKARSGGNRVEFYKYQKRAKQLVVNKVKELNLFII